MGRNASGIFFDDFHPSKEIELNGENEKTGWRKLKIRDLRKLEDLARVPAFFHQFLGKMEVPTLTLEASLVLELEFMEINKINEYYMVLYELLPSLPFSSPPT